MTTELEAAKQLYREEVKFSAAPILDQAIMNWTNAVKFAEIGIRGGLTLNGAGLLFLPPFLALLKIELMPVSATVLASLSLFAAGLLASWLVCFFSFFSANKMAQALNLQYSSIVGTQARFYFPKWDGAPSKSTIEDHEDAARDGIKVSRRFRLASMVAAFLSLALFILGAALGAWALFRGIGTAIK